MKKLFVVGVLFALPIVAYLFFASGVNDFAKLPVLTENIQTLEGFQGLDGEEVQFDEKITILGFFGKDPSDYTGNTYNLASKIYDNYYKFNDFQVVILAAEGSQDQAREIKKKMENIVDPQKWKFAFGNPKDIKNLFRNLGTKLILQEDLGSPYVFIIDKKGNLRGRNDDEDKGLLYGYDTRSVAELNDKMEDDVKVILAEYRLELKKYNSEEE